MSALGLTRLSTLMNRTSGDPNVVVGLIDGPVCLDHPDLEYSNIVMCTDHSTTPCTSSGLASAHGTFVAGILSARRGSKAPAICPGCTLLVCPIFIDEDQKKGQPIRASPSDLARMIYVCIARGVKVINLSLAALRYIGLEDSRILDAAVSFAAHRGVIIVAASGNDITSSPILRHRWVIPVVACALDGRPANKFTLSPRIGRGGLAAPGDSISSLDSGGQLGKRSGTSVATPFVTGTIALLWSLFPSASATQIRLAITQSRTGRSSVFPPLLDAESAYLNLSRMYGGGERLGRVKSN